MLTVYYLLGRKYHERPPDPEPPSDIEEQIASEQEIIDYGSDLQQQQQQQQQQQPIYPQYGMFFAQFAEFPTGIKALEVGLGIALVLILSHSQFALGDPILDCVLNIGLTSGLVPLLFRWSYFYWDEDVEEFEMYPLVFTCVWSACCYLTGGVLLIVYRNTIYGMADLVLVSSVIAIVISFMVVIDLIYVLKSS